MARRLFMAIGILLVLVVVGVRCVAELALPAPTDTRIVYVLQENEVALLGIEGVVGAGVARGEDNYIIGIAVYVEDDVSDLRRIPGRLGGFDVFVKRVSEASEFEREGMIVRR